MIYLTGDTHIPIDIDKLSMKNFPAQKKLTRNDYVIVLGDFGLLWKEDKTYKYWLDILSKRNFTLLFIDGNHENFDWLNSLPAKTWNGGRIHEIAPNILHLMRGYVFNIDNKKFFVMGGADSYDRTYRTPYVSWWPQERPSFTDIRQTEKTLRAVDGKVDYVLTHTCPLEVLTAIKKRHPEYSFDNEDHYVENLLQDIKDRLIFKEWFFGHWHENFTYNNYHCLYDDIVCLNDAAKKLNNMSCAR